MRRNKMFFAAVGACLLLAAGATPMAVAQSATRQQLCHRIYETATAWQNGNFARINRFLTPGFVHTDDHGRFMSRATWLKEERSRVAHIKDLNLVMRDIRIVMLNKDAAVTGMDIIWNAKQHGTAAEHLRFTAIWTVTPSGWQRVAWQGETVFKSLKCKIGARVTCSGQASWTPPKGIPFHARGRAPEPEPPCHFVDMSPK